MCANWRLLPAAVARAWPSKHEAIVDVRGKGLMIAAELDSADLAKLTVAEMLERKILINCTSDTVLRFLPPYILGARACGHGCCGVGRDFYRTCAAHSAAIAIVKHAGGQKSWLARHSIERSGVLGQPPAEFQ
jgi:hypothetical protein